MFYSHHICSMEGGVVVTNDSMLYEYMLSIRAHGWTRNLTPGSAIYEKNEDPFYEKYNFIMPGYNLRPLEIEAAIGIEQIDKIESIIANRRSNADYFLSEIKKTLSFRTQNEVGESSWFGFPMILERTDLSRDKIVTYLENRGIETRPIVAGNFVRNKAVEYLNYRVYGELINADFIHYNGFFVGNHSYDNREKIKKMFALIEKYK